MTEAPAGWWVDLVAYRYLLDNSTGAELVAYHWHPDAGFDERACSTSASAHPLQRRMHLPTGRVPLEDFVAFLAPLSSISGGER